jgi:hypothetical protein
MRVLQLINWLLSDIQQFTLRASLLRLCSDQPAMAFQSIAEELSGPSTKLSRLMMKMCFRFAGMPQSDEVLDEIMAEALENQESIWDGLRDQYREVSE